MSDTVSTDENGNVKINTNNLVRFDIDKDYTVDLSKVKMSSELGSIVTSMFDLFLKRDAEMMKIMRSQAEQEGMFRGVSVRLNMIVAALTSEARVLRKERDEARARIAELEAQLAAKG